MNLQEILDKLYALHRFGIKPGLERTQYLLQQVGNPERNFKSIHVAGTNGKGSVCSMMASVMMEQGYTTGLYTSPHVHDFNERIRINGLMIRDEQIVEYAEELFPHVDAIGATFFEATTAMAFMHFAQNSVDCAVIETGLGGRFDSTTVVTPLVSVITSIDLDHQEYLGDSLEAIAGEKAGIIKAQVPVIVGEPRAELRTVFMERAALVDAPLLFLDDSAKASNVEYQSDCTMTLSAQSRFGELDTVEIGLAGEHQVRNVLMVMEAAEEVRAQLPLSQKAMREGLANVKQNSGLEGRIEMMLQDLPLILDVGHNPACLRELVKTLHLCGYEETQWNIVFGVMADKDYHQMLDILKPVCKTLYACAPQNSRALDADILFAAAREKGIDTRLVRRVSDAVTTCLEKEEATLVLGSFYVAEEAASAFCF